MKQRRPPSCSSPLSQSVFALVANPDATPVLSTPAVGVVIAVVTVVATKEGGDEPAAVAMKIPGESAAVKIPTAAVEITTSEVAAVTEMTAAAKMAAAHAAVAATTAAHTKAASAAMAAATPTAASAAFGEGVMGY